MTDPITQYLDREHYRLNSDVEGLFHEITETLSEVATAIISNPKISAAEITKMLDQAESDLSSNVRDYPHLVVETKRRVAEWKFDLLDNVNCPFELMAAVQQSIRDLGYFDLDREITREIIFARYCIRSDEPALAESVLANIDKKLGRAIEDDNFGVTETTPQLRQYFRDLKKIVRELREEIRS